MLDLAIVADGGFGKKRFGLGTIKARMNAGNVVERLGDADPARQDGDIGNEADIAHELVALGPRIAAQHSQLSLIGSEAENRVQRGGFAGAVRSDDAENATIFHAQINAVKRNGCSK